MPRKQIIFFVGLCGWMVLSLTLFAAHPINPRTSKEVRQCAADLADLIHQEHQTRLLGLSMGTIEEVKQTVQFRIHLVKDALYIFTACGEKTLTDLGLRVFSQKEEKVGESQELSQRPILLFRPPSSEVFIIEVYSDQGTGHFALINTVK